jgi:chorismate synthase
LAGSIKWLTTDCRNTIERASARETAARVAAGALTRCLLERFGVDLVGYVVSIGPHRATIGENRSAEDIRQTRDGNDAYCPDVTAAATMIEAIRQAGQDGDTLGGVVEVRVIGLCPGLGCCMRSQDKLDGRLLGALGSIQAIKGVEIGLGFESATLRGRQVHDEIHFDSSHVNTPSLGFVRPTNRAGGIEGGMTNGQPLVIRAAMKPISTLVQGMQSVDLRTRQTHRSAYERSDICAAPAASVVAENVVAFEIARAFLEKFGGDTLSEVEAAYQYFLTTARQLGHRQNS